MIKAIHIQTMRVRIGTFTVLDATYVPQDFLDIVPFEMYNDVRVVHPMIHLLDYHTIFSFPFKNSPQEDISYRWVKIQERMNNNFKMLRPAKSTTKTDLREMEIPKHSFPYIPYGFHALSILYDVYQTLKQHIKLTYTPIYDFRLTDTHFTCPMFMTTYDIIVDNNDPQVSLKGTARYSLLNVRKRTIVSDTMTAWLLDDDALSVAKHNDQLIPNVNYVLNYLLGKSIIDQNHKEAYISVYNDLMDMMLCVQEALERAPKEVILTNPFCLNLTTFGGSFITTENYMTGLESLRLRLFKKRSSSPFLLPRNYFFQKKDIIVESYDYKNGRAFYPLSMDSTT